MEIIWSKNVVYLEIYDGDLICYFSHTDVFWGVTDELARCQEVNDQYLEQLTHNTS